MVLLASVIISSAARAQWHPAAYPQVRVDGIFERGSTAQLGAGSVIPFGYYVRLGVTAAGGVTRRDGLTLGSGRVDVIARYLLDPFRETRHALSLGGGVSFAGDAARRTRPYLVIVADLEGRQHGGWTPAVQLGLGGGARLGLVFRRSKSANR